MFNINLSLIFDCFLVKDLITFQAVFVLFDDWNISLLWCIFFANRIVLVKILQYLL
jgi:hypothetical protein